MNKTLLKLEELSIPKARLVACTLTAQVNPLF